METPRPPALDVCVSEENKRSSRSLKIFVASAVNVIVSLSSTIIFFRELYALQDYPLFSNTLNTLSAVVVPVLVGVAFSGHAGRWRRDCVSQNLWKPFPRWSWVYVFLGTLNALQNSMQIAATDGLGSKNSNLCTLLNQLTVPFSMILTVLIVKSTSYSLWHIVGASCVVGGVAVSVAPHVDTKDSISIGWVVVFVLSCIPQSILNIWVERMVGSARSPSLVSSPFSLTMTVVLDINFLVGIINLISIPLNLLFGFMMDPIGTHWQRDYADGFTCVFHRQKSLSDGNDHCRNSWMWVVGFAPLGVLYVLVNFILVQQVSATWYFLVVAFSLPIANFLLSSRAIMGDVAGDWSASNVYGLVVITAGMCLYCWGLLKKRDRPSTPQPLSAPYVALEESANTAIGHPAPEGAGGGISAVV